MKVFYILFLFCIFSPLCGLSAKPHIIGYQVSIEKNKYIEAIGIVEKINQKYQNTKNTIKLFVTYKKKLEIVIVDRNTRHISVERENRQKELFQAFEKTFGKNCIHVSWEEISPDPIWTLLIPIFFILGLSSVILYAAYFS